MPRHGTLNATDQRAYAPIQLSEKQRILTLCKLGAADDEAFAFVQWMENMVGQNVIAEIRVQIAKFDAAHNARISKLDAWIETEKAKLDAQQREFRLVRWMIGLGFTALAILITVLELLD